MSKLPHRPDVAAGLPPHRFRRHHTKLELGAPIIIGYGCSTIGAAWASPGDRLIVGVGDKPYAARVIGGQADHVIVDIIGGERVSVGDVLVMRAPTLPLDRRALVRRARIGGGP